MFRDLTGLLRWVLAGNAIRELGVIPCFLGLWFRRLPSPVEPIFPFQINSENYEWMLASGEGT